jgi:GNAT superfamily N-acetyltransferase
MAEVYKKSIKGHQLYISTDQESLQVDRIHRFLCDEAYWSLLVPIEVVRKALENSLCFGVFLETLSGPIQVGLARIITDRATFAYLCDIYIENDQRGLGLSKWLMECVLCHPDLQRLRRLLLATVDAHALYKKFGFEVSSTPERWMEIKDTEIYKNWQKKIEI